MNIRCVVVDDEKPARDELCYLLSKVSGLEVVGEADSVGSSCGVIQKKRPDLVFLDIQMPGSNGFELLRELDDLETLPHVVFVTAFDNYAVKAFEKNAVDYILKPVSEERLRKTIDRVRKRHDEKKNTPLKHELERLLQVMARQNKSEVRVSVECGGRVQLIPPHEIVYCSLESQKLMVNTKTEKYPLYGVSTLEKLAAHLHGLSFFRVHRSVLVNLDHIKEFSPWFNGKYNLIMNDVEKSEVTVSRARVRDFKQRLGI